LRLNSQSSIFDLMNLVLSPCPVVELIDHVLVKFRSLFLHVLEIVNLVVKLESNAVISAFKYTVVCFFRLLFTCYL
jgi:hypothetical protein